MAVPPEFLIKVEKSTAGSTFGCLPATGCRRFEYGRPKPSIPVNQSSARRHVPAVYLADANLAIVAILEVREMNNLRVCSRLSVLPPASIVLISYHTLLVTACAVATTSSFSRCNPPYSNLAGWLQSFGAPCSN